MARYRGSTATPPGRKGVRATTGEPGAAILPGVLSERLLGLVIIVIVGCAPDGSGDRSETGRAAQPTSGAEPPVRLVTRAEIGGFGARPEHEFGNVSALAVDAAGRVYVADTHAQNLRVFDSTGVYVRTIGRQGQGPGEFLWPSGVAWENDSTLWILDRANGRYSVYDTSGAHRGDHRRPTLGSFTPWPARFDRGRLIEASLAGGVYRLVAIQPNAPTSPPPDTFPYPLSDRPMSEWNPSYYARFGDAVRRVKAPYREGLEWVLDGQGAAWTGDTETYVLTRRSLDGDTLNSMRVNIGGAPLSAEERAVATELLTSMGHSPSELPARKPAFRRLLVSENGGLWAFREGAGSRWYLDRLYPGPEVSSFELLVEPDLNVQPVLRSQQLWLVRSGSYDEQIVVRLSP